MPDETKQPMLPVDPADKPAVAEQAAQQLAKQPRTVKELLQGDEFKKALQAVLPAVMRPDRFIRVALTTMMKIPELGECSRESLFRCLLDCSSLGLEPDGRRAHLIPFKNRKNNTMECQLIIDYKGIAELVRRSGDVSYVHADVVYGNDEWSYAYGTEAHLKHRPNPKDRGQDRVAYYSYVRFKDGSEDFIVMNPSEVERIRKRSKSPDQGPWVTDYDEMGKKTAFRRHSKWLPLSPEVRNVIEKEDTEAVDVSGWEEVLDEGAKQLEAGAKERPKLRDRVMSAAQETGEPPKE